MLHPSTQDLQNENERFTRCQHDILDYLLILARVEPDLKQDMNQILT